VYGQTVVLTDTVSSASSGTPTGTITFYDGNPASGGVPISCSGSGAGVLNQQQPDVATCSTSSLAIGVHQIYAPYGGDGTFAPSAGNHRTVTVSKDPSSVTVTASTYSPLFGQTVMLTATVSSASSGTPTGSVTFYDGNPASGGVPVSCSGSGAGVLNQQQPDVATCSTSSLAVGVHQIYAPYAGDATFAATNGGYRTVTVRP
jgi:hypothetical protein